jgi:hypothetical protein
MWSYKWTLFWGIAALCSLLWSITTLDGLPFLVSMISLLGLRHLPRFQQITDVLIRDERAKANAEAFLVAVKLPPAYRDLDVGDTVLIDSRKENVTVRYITRDSSALGHRGYLYALDDSPAGLLNEYPSLGYHRLAPHWFFFSD